MLHARKIMKWIGSNASAGLPTLPRERAKRCAGVPAFKSVARLTCALWLATGGIALSAPVIKSLEPGTVAPGAVTEVVARGSDLKGIVNVWCSFPVEVAVDSSKSAEDGKSASLRFTVPAETEVGVAAIRVVGSNGVSRPFLLMIDDLPGATAVKGNDAFDKAASLDWPIAIDGVCDDSYSDFYRFKLRRGRRVTFECVAQRMGSTLDPLLRLYDEERRQVAQSEDAAGLVEDARFSFIPQASGSYTLEVGDAIYRKSAANRYRLRAGDIPLATLPFPLGGEPGGEVEVRFLGEEMEGVKGRTISLAPDRSRQRVGVSREGEKGAAFVTLASDALPDLVESEPNDDPGQATRISVPSAINGRFERPNDRDCYAFEVKKGDTLAFVGQTRSLGSPSALFLQLYDPKGALLEEADVTKSNEAGLTNRFATDGVHTLRIEELTRAGGPAHGYRMEIEPWRPGFGLSTSVDTINAKAGGSLELRIEARRDKGFNAPITLAVEGLWDGATVEGNEIGKDNKEATLKIELPKEITPGDWRQIKVVGQSGTGDTAFKAAASPEPALRKLFPGMPFPPTDLDGWIAVGIKAE